MDNAALFFLIFGLGNQFPLLDNQMVFGANQLIFFAFITAGIAAILGKTREKKALLTSFMGIILTLAFIKLIRVFVQEPRPFITYQFEPLIEGVRGLSFPSVHTAVMATVTFAFIFYKSKVWPIFLLALVWIGLARVYTGVHYPIDILGGVVVAFFSVLIIWQLKIWLRSKF